MSILFIILFAKVYLAVEKTAIHVDESLTFSISCFGKYEEIKDNSIFDRNSFLTVFYDYPLSLKQTVKDIAKLRISGIDTPHTNLYYTLIRIISIGADNNFDELIFRGCILNLILFSISTFILWKITHFFSSNYKFRLFVTFISLLSAASFSNSLFVRTYQIQEVSFLLITYIFLDLYRSTTYKFSYTSSIFHIFSLSLALLSGYFGLLYIAILGTILLAKHWKNNHTELIKYIIYTSTCAIVAAFAIHSQFLRGLFDYRGTEAVSKIDISYFTANFIEITTNYISVISKHILSPTGIMLVIFMSIFVLYKKLHNHKKFLLNPETIILITSLLWSLVVLFLAPYKDLRYIMAIAPIIISTTIFTLFKDKNRIFLIILATCILHTNIYGIENLNKSSGTIYFTENTICILNNAKWKLNTIAPFLKNNTTKLIYCDNVHSFKKYLTDKNIDLFLIEKNIIQTDSFLKDILQNGNDVNGYWYSYTNKSLTK